MTRAPPNLRVVQPDEPKKRKPRAVKPKCIVHRLPEPERIVAYRGAKIRLWIDHEHVARVLRRKREICGGEMVNGETI